MFCCFGQCEITFLKRPFVKGVISGTTYNHILDWRVLEVVKLTFGSYLFLIQSKNHENFDPLPACMWKTSGVEWICFLNSYSILEISGEQQLFHFITRCKGKSLICFSWLMHARKMKVFIFSPWYPWYPWYLLHPQKKSKCFSQSFQLWLPSNEKTWGGSSQSMIYKNINNFTVY